MRRVILCAALAASLAPALAPPLDAQARQNSGGGRRIARRVLFAGVGAAIGGLAGTTYVLFRGQEQPGSCGNPTCVLIVTLGSGTLLGYMIGREFDDLHALRYRGGAPLHPKDVSIGLSGEPNVLAVRDQLVAVGGNTGVQLFRSGAGFQAQPARARGVRGIAALDITPPGALTLGSLSGLYVYPPVTGRGTLVREGEIMATSAATDRVYFAAGARIESAPLTADTARTWPGLTLDSPVRAIRFDASNNILWAVTDSALVSLRPTGDSLSVVGRLAMPSGARRVSAGEGRVAVAFGEGGVRVMDAANPAAPREISAWTGARFSYDVALAAGRVFVAAGPEGVYVLEAGEGDPRVVGLARELGFAAAIEAEGPYLYILDRRTNALRRISSDFQ
ncbi:MAG: hypothetical protein WKG32_07730 [Gemmatimonadaceae bacterium]